MAREKIALAIEEKDIPVEDIIIINEDMPFKQLPEEELERLKKTIAQYGLVYKPVVIPVKHGDTTKYYLVDGRNRIIALIQLGYKEIPCTIIKALPEERKALSYIIEFCRRHVPEKERKESEEKFHRVIQDSEIQTKEKIKSLLGRYNVPRSIIARIIKSLSPKKAAELYDILETNIYALVPVLKAALGAQSNQITEEDIAKTEEVIKRLEKEKNKAEEEKKKLEEELQKVLQEKEEAESRAKMLEEEMQALESELARIRQEESQDTGKPEEEITLTPDHPKVKELIDKHARELAEKLAEKMAEKKAKIKANEITRAAVEQILREKAELVQQVETFKNERNIFLRKSQELAEKVEDLQKKLEIYKTQEKSWQDSVDFLRNILSNIVSLNGALKRLTVVNEEIKAIEYSLKILKEQALETIQENQLLSLKQKFQDLEGNYLRLSKVIKELEDSYRAVIKGEEI